MKRTNSGFTLIELMIVVAIVGVLSAIALPTYANYLVRSKTSEAVAAVAACKTSYAEYVSTKNAFPADAETAGCSNTASQFVAKVEVLDMSATTGTPAGVPSIKVTTVNTGSKNAGTLQACELILTPTADDVVTPTALTAWAGSHTGCDANYVPSNFRS